MKRLLIVVLVALVAISAAACAGQQTTVTEPTTVEQTPVAQPEWSFDENSKTLYINTDMGAFEPDKPDFDGTSSNAPWAEFLPEIEHIVVGDEVTYIGDYALAFCSNLKSAEIGENVSALDFRCFFKCGDFENDSNIDFYFNSTPEFGEDVFGYTWDNPNVVVYVPDDMKAYWADFLAQKGEMILDGYDMGQQMSQSKDDVLYSMLFNPQELWGEGSGGFAENNGGEFGGGVRMGYNADMQRLEIFGEDTGACAVFNTSLKTCMFDVGMEQVPQQAVMVKFSASDITNGVRFSFEAQDEITFSFREDGMYFVDVANFYETPFTSYMPNNFEMKDETIYYFFFAYDDNGDIRALVWEDGFSENHAFFEYDLYQDADDINNSDIVMYLGVGANAQFNVYEYAVYTFESYMEGMPYFLTEESPQETGDMDYGPSWNINIANNFDIMSDMVWQSVQVQDIDAGGNMYKGYNLAEMMDFSGNGSDKARVTFGQEGSDSAEVSRTGEAFIVFMKNGEFMGGPYLLDGDRLYDIPIIQVDPE